MHDQPARPWRLLRGGALWIVAAIGVAGLVLAPFASLLFQALQGADAGWGDLAIAMAGGPVANTLMLLLGVGVLAGAIGVGAAWLVSAHDFRGRGVMEWALMLPLAMPTYIIAYAYLDLLHPIGALQTGLRHALGYASPRDFRLPDIRSLAGCIILLGFVLYPYVYITTRALFLTQGADLLAAARTLGASRRATLWRVALPLARPAIAVGLSLALMEALNDIGASEFLGVQTVTVAVYTTWVTRANLPGAAQMALLLLVVVVALTLVERLGRRNRAYGASARRAAPMVARRVQGANGALMLGACLVPVIIGFLAPAGYLAAAAWTRLAEGGLPDSFASIMTSTIALAAIATVCTLICGVATAFAARLKPQQASRTALRLAAIGYAAPGAVVAIGVLFIAGHLDAGLNALGGVLFGAAPGLILIGSGAALIYAYMVRFLAIAAGGVEAGLSRIPLSLDHAARSLGHGPLSLLRRIHLPQAKAAVVSAALLVFVDCVKELPATLMLRPLNVETLATHLYGEAARGTYEDAALSALAIVIIAMAPVVLLARTGRISGDAR